MQNAGLDEAQARIKIAKRNINNLRYADNTTFMAESEEELKSLLMKVKEESEKAGLKLNIQKMKIMASGLITSWQIAGETMDTVRDFIWGFPKLRYFGHLMQRVDSLEKDSDAGRDWGQEEKGTTEDEMAGWHHRLDGHRFG